MFWWTMYVLDVTCLQYVLAVCVNDAETHDVLFMFFVFRFEWSICFVLIVLSRYQSQACAHIPR